MLHMPLTQPFGTLASSSPIYGALLRDKTLKVSPINPDACRAEETFRVSSTATGINPGAKNHAQSIGLLIISTLNLELGTWNLKLETCTHLPTEH